jgi:hypothetical protein
MSDINRELVVMGGQACENRRPPTDKINTLTETQLNIEIRIIDEKAHMVDKICCICEENAIDILFGCNHTCCYQCTLLWLQKENTCPFCREDIRNLVNIYKTNLKSMTEDRLNRHVKELEDRMVHATFNKIRKKYNTMGPIMKIY